MEISSKDFRLVDKNALKLVEDSTDINLYREARELFQIATLVNPDICSRADIEGALKAWHVHSLPLEKRVPLLRSIRMCEQVPSAPKLELIRLN